MFAIGFNRKLCTQLPGYATEVDKLCDSGIGYTFCKNNKTWMVRLRQGRICIQKCRERYFKVPSGMIHSILLFYTAKCAV